MYLHDNSHTQSFLWVEVGHSDICRPKVTSYCNFRPNVFLKRNFQDTILEEILFCAERSCSTSLWSHRIIYWKAVFQNIDTSYKCCKQRERIPGMEIWKPGSNHRYPSSCVTSDEKLSCSEFGKSCLNWER